MSLGKRKKIIISVVFLALLGAVLGYFVFFSEEEYAPLEPKVVEENIRGNIITSPDGFVELVIPKLALPDNIFVQDISIRKLEPIELPVPEESKISFVGYALKPEGLLLRQPALLRIRHPIVGNPTMPFIFRISDRDIETHDGAKVFIDLNEREFVVEFSVDKFTDILFSRVGGIGEATISKLGDASIGEPFSVEIILSLMSDPVSIIDADGKIRTYAITNETWTIKNGRYFANAERRPRISPEEIKDQPRSAEVLGRAYVHEQEFSCIRWSARSSIWYAAELELNQKITIQDPNDESDIVSTSPWSTLAIQIGTPLFRCNEPSKEILQDVYNTPFGKFRVDQLTLAEGNEGATCEGLYYKSTNDSPAVNCSGEPIKDRAGCGYGITAEVTQIKAGCPFPEEIAVEKPSESTKSQ